MCGDLPTSFSGYVIFEGLWMFFGKLQNLEITVLSTAFGILCKYIFMKAGLCSQFFCSYCLL